jgi:glycosyltransferase involved in cell wall biosynthesis
VRLLFVNSAWPESWGGGEKWTVEAAAWFRDQRHQTAVASWPDSMLLQAAKRRELETIEFKFAGDFDPFATARAKRVLKQYRPDCVVVNFNKEAWLFGRAARSLKIPVLARHGFPLLQNKIHHRYLLKRLITKLVVNAESIREGYLSLGLDASKAIVIHNGAKEVEAAKGELRTRFKINNDEILILAAGRLESQKRFDRVIELAKVLCPANKNLRFVILGSGPLREELQRQIDSQQLSDQVQLGKFLRNFAGAVHDADLFLLTSDNEGSPNVLLEAMAAGVCCLATPVGAVPQIFGEEFPNQIIDANNLYTTAQRITQLAANADELRRIGDAMSQRVRNHFSFDKSMRAFETILAQLCLSKR